MLQQQIAELRERFAEWTLHHKETIDMLKEKVSAEIVLSFLTYNLRRAIKLLGVGALVAHFNTRKQENRGLDCLQKNRQ